MSQRPAEVASRHLPPGKLVPAAMTLASRLGWYTQRTWSWAATLGRRGVVAGPTGAGAAHAARNSAAAEVIARWRPWERLAW